MSHELLRLRTAIDPAAGTVADRPRPGPEDPSALTLVWTPRAAGPPPPPGYHLGRRLGAGGFAEVFAAELHQPPQPPKRVALKRLLPGLRDDPTRRRQLRREAQIATRLDHKNIVRVFELLELGDELLIAMELVEGVQASRLLHHLAAGDRRLRLPVVAYLLRGLFAALDYLETGAPLMEAAPGPPLGSSRPLVHADISLENLMLTTAGGVKLIDFGLAGEDRSLPPRLPAGEDQSLTALHQVAGKPTYTPPGEGGRLPGAPTVQSDLYAAGVCAWELLTGRRFPALPPGAAARELGSLISFAAAGLPAAGWQLLQLCLAVDPAAPRCTAAQGLALLHQLGPQAVSPPALGALVQTLVADEPAPAALPADLVASLTEPAAFADTLVQRLHGAFCAHRVVLLQPASDSPRPAVPAPGSFTAPTAARESAAATARFTVQACCGAALDLPPWAAAGQALRRGQAEDPAGGLYYRLPASSSGAATAPGRIVCLEPGPGHVYDPLAQALLKNLLSPAAQPVDPASDRESP